MHGPMWLFVLMFRSREMRQLFRGIEDSIAANIPWVDGLSMDPWILGRHIICLIYYIHFFCCKHYYK